MSSQPAPARRISQLGRTRARDGSGHRIPHETAHVPDRIATVEKEALAAAPAIDAALMQELWLGSTDGRPQTLNELIAIPALTSLMTKNGFDAADT